MPGVNRLVPGRLDPRSPYSVRSDIREPPVDVASKVGYAMDDRRCGVGATAWATGGVLRGPLDIVLDPANTRDGGCELNADAELCVRLCPNAGGIASGHPGGTAGSSNGVSNGLACVTAGCGVRGPRGDCLASGFDNRRTLGGSGSLKGFAGSFSLSSSMSTRADCDDTLLFFFRSRFLSLFLLEERRTGTSAAKKPSRPFVLAE